MKEANKFSFFVSDGVILNSHRKRFFFTPLRIKTHGVLKNPLRDQSVVCKECYTESVVRFRAEYNPSQKIFFLLKWSDFLSPKVNVC